MSFQGYQGEENTKVGCENSGADAGAQIIRLSQIQLAHIV